MLNLYNTLQQHKYHTTPCNTKNLQTNVSVTTFTSPFYQILSPVSPRRKNIIDYHKTTHYDRLPLRPRYRITTKQLRPERQDDRTTERQDDRTRSDRTTSPRSFKVDQKVLLYKVPVQYGRTRDDVHVGLAKKDHYYLHFWLQIYMELSLLQSQWWVGHKVQTLINRIMWGDGFCLLYHYL